MDAMDINGRRVTVRELTVREVHAWFKELDSRVQHGGFDLVDETLFADANLEDLLIMTDLNREEMDGFTPSQLAAVLEKVREVNSHFFDQRRRLIKVAKPDDTPQAPQSV